MATYNQISYGSTGSDVKKLQELLNQNDYNLDVDGSFGPKTQAAVKDYQNKNGLKVDGIVGTNTWGALTKNQAGANTAGSNSQAEAAPGYSDAVNRAYEMLNQNLSQKPVDDQNQWQNQLDDTLNKILNREKFSYDLNGDALYQQYKDQYIQNGKMAMMDTMGQAQAMTGGYGNSYAQSVGQQAYQGYLQQLNDKVPELYQLAYDQYNQEGQDLYNQYALLNSQDEKEYGRYRDALSDWLADRDYLTGRYDTALGYQYQIDRDKVADAQFNEQMALSKEQWAWEKAQAERANGSGGSGIGKSGYDLDHVSSMSSEEIVSAMTNYKAAEDNSGLEAFLDDLVNTGRIEEEQADKWYEQYRIKGVYTPTGTDVKIVNPPIDKSHGYGGKHDYYTVKN